MTAKENWSIPAYQQHSFDIHPINSCHVETVVLLNKNFERPKDYVQIGIDAEDYYRIKDARK